VASLFDYSAIDDLCSTYAGLSVDLSGYSVGLIVCALALMQDRTNWTTMTNMEWDVLEALVSDALGEIDQV